jgi:hypothetical protein
MIAGACLLGCRVVMRYRIGMSGTTDAAAIREAYEADGELSAAIEMRRRFPGIADNATAREQARRIAAWTPLPPRPARRRKDKADTKAR